MAKKEQKTSVWTIILILLGLFLVSSCTALLITKDSFEEGNVAVIPVKGVILGDDTPGLFSDGASSREIVRMIKKADKDDNIKAIVFEINSPGGSAVASDEIGQAIKQSEKHTVSWMREVGASGGYWVASATDHIIANRMTITGSIGVIGSYVEFPDFLTRFNMSYNQLIGGEYKDIGTPYRHLEDFEKEIMQSKIDKIHDYFIIEVANNRNLSENETREIANGLIYLGVEAYDLGLVDELGSSEELKKHLEEQIGEEPKFVHYKQEPSFLDIISSIFFNYGFGLGKGQTDFLTQDQFIARV